MNSKMTKLAAAAVVIATAVLGTMFFDKTSSPVYALGQSVKALENVAWMHVDQNMKRADDKSGETWFSAAYKISASLVTKTGLYCIIFYLCLWRDQVV